MIKEGLFHLLIQWIQTLKVQSTLNFHFSQRSWGSWACYRIRSTYYNMGAHFPPSLWCHPCLSTRVWGLQGISEDGSGCGKEKSGSTCLLHHDLFQKKEIAACKRVLPIPAFPYTLRLHCCWRGEFWVIWEHSSWAQKESSTVSLVLCAEISASVGKQLPLSAALQRLWRFEAVALSANNTLLPEGLRG